MNAFLEIARTGVAAVLLHPLRSLVTTVAVVAVLLPFLAGQALSHGVRAEAELAIDHGADLYVTGERFGRPVPVPLSALASLRGLEGVVEVVPRIVGGIVLGKDGMHAVVVGMPRERFPSAIACVDGDLGGGSKLNELVLGSELARRLHLQVGDVLPPFYRNSRGERLSRVAGLFRSDVSLWQANLLFTSFETAAEIFDQPGLATDLLVTCRPGYQAHVAAAIRRLDSLDPREAATPLRPRVTERDTLRALLPSGLLHREGIFNLHFVVAISVAIVAVLVTSGIGLTERRREVGILKAVGWQTDEVLLRAGVESLVLSLAGSALAVVLAYVWLAWFNGYGIAAVFLAGVDPAPSFPVPFELAPVPALLTFAVSLLIVHSGTLFSSWRAAVVSPVEALR